MKINYDVGEDTGDEFPVLKGIFLAEVQDTEIKEAKSGQGNRYLEILWSILGGNHDGLPVRQRLNLWNRNAQAVDIARRQMNQTCRALGITSSVGDTEELHGRIAKLHMRPQRNNESFHEVFKVEAASATAVREVERDRKDRDRDDDREQESGQQYGSQQYGGPANDDYDDDIPF